MIVFFDIDGTLVTEGVPHIAPESAIRAIRAARENGHLMYINTGRTMNNVDQYIRDIGFDGYVCGCGTHIEADGETLLYRTVPKDTCLEIVELMRKCDMAPAYERRDCFFSDSKCRDLGGLKRLRIILNGEGKDFSRDVSDADFGFDKLVAWYDEKSDLDAFKKGIAAEFDYIDRGYGFCELAVKGLSKGTGVNAVCAHYGADISDTIAIGDSLNDMPMLLAAGHSVAIGGSRDELTRTVEFVTKPVTEDGIEYALKHYGLI